MRQFILKSDTLQRFGVILEGRRATISLRHVKVLDRWFMSISKDESPVVLGLKIVSDVDLLKPFGLGLGSIFVTGETPRLHSFTNGTSTMFHASEEEVRAAVSPKG